MNVMCERGDETMASEAKFAGDPDSMQQNDFALDANQLEEVSSLSVAVMKVPYSSKKQCCVRDKSHLPALKTGWKQSHHAGAMKKLLLQAGESTDWYDLMSSRETFFELCHSSSPLQLNQLARSKEKMAVTTAEDEIAQVDLKEAVYID
ncbi:hypothetical protein WMY93_005187 [Mugilogobius chulae]|uniref:Uncharacterized protein n=1 Tax=Mugilogobius chulae TaxID=88201 RepID=A0AAW0PU82_9GOBI